MCEHPLYQALQKELAGYLPSEWSASQREGMIQLILGIIGSGSSRPSRIAQALTMLGIGSGRADSQERQVRRWENEAALQDPVGFHAYARHHLLWGKPKRLVLVIDPTTHTEDWVLLTVSVVYRGRSLPLAWSLWAGNRPFADAGFWERVAMLLDLIAQLLPSRLPVIWLADRAFGTPKFTDLVCFYGWDYIVRVQGQTRYLPQVGKTARIDSLVQRKGQRRKLRGQVFKNLGWRTASVVAYWGNHHHTPLLLVSSLPPHWELIALYRHRYTIEALFRDYKSAGWHWEQSQVRHAAHCQVLLLAMAFATWFTLQVGTLVAAELLAHPPTARRYTPPWHAKFSLFQLGLQRLARWLNRTELPVIPMPPFHWDAPSWSRQITHHHAFAFVMRS